MSNNILSVETNSPEETEKFANSLASILEPGDVICLDGDLGAGKTAFTRGVARSLGIREHITSPTFTIVNEYEGKMPLYHFDVYRIEDSSEMLEIGFDEYIDGNGICVIEWAKNIMDIIPPDHIDVTIKKDYSKDDSYRQIILEPKGEKYKSLINSLGTMK